MVQIDPTQSVPLHVDATGTIRVAGTRLTLSTVVSAYRDGATAEELCLQFPGVSLQDFHACLAYYLNHQVELDEHLAECELEAEQLRHRFTSAPDYQRFVGELRKRFAARNRRAS